jgi:repressor LexA
VNPSEEIQRLVTDDPNNPESPRPKSKGAAGASRREARRIEARVADTSAAEVGAEVTEGDAQAIAQSWLPFPIQAPRVRPPLTSTQKQVLDFIVEFRGKQGVSPTLQEIGDRLQTHRVTVHAHVKALLDKKYLVRFSDRASRSLIPVDELTRAQGDARRAHAESAGAGEADELESEHGRRPGDSSDGASHGGDVANTTNPSGPLLLPLAGRIAAGQPIEAVYDNEVLDIAALFPRERDLYVLEVSGDSMIDDQIRSGDYVVVERRSTARNGEIVVAVLPSEFGGHGAATLKRFYREGKRVRLQPANAKLDPIYVEPPSRLEVQGVVVGIVRRYR